LDHQRRLVRQFYQRPAGFYDMHMITVDQISLFWSVDDLPEFKLFFLRQEDRKNPEVEKSNKKSSEQRQLQHLRTMGNRLGRFLPDPRQPDFTRTPSRARAIRKLDPQHEERMPGGFPKMEAVPQWEMDPFFVFPSGCQCLRRLAPRPRITQTEGFSLHSRSPPFSDADQGPFAGRDSAAGG
jgi:hypothetical protein